MGELFAFLKPALDAHTLGINSIAELLRSCGYSVLIGPKRIAEALNEVAYKANRDPILAWLRDNEVTRLGLSYRLDPEDALRLVGYLLSELRNQEFLAYQGGPIRGLYFAGLPSACTAIDKEYRGLVQTFRGGESVRETLKKLEIPEEKIPAEITEGCRYDDWRHDFGREVIASGAYRQLSPLPRADYPGFGTRQDTLERRLTWAQRGFYGPLMRAHVGPFSGTLDRIESVREFFSWARSLAKRGFLDILSIGTSQLTQECFGEDWEDRPNGGGVPINSPLEYRAVWEHSRPLLVRTYAGTKNIPKLAAIHEDTLNICWHALSLWWFNELDGRGPYTLAENLTQHLETIKYVAETEKPLEANVPHHFAFRGADDLTYLVSAYLAAKLAKKMGIKTFVLQNMLNTPRFTWGIQDLAKSRALLALVGQLADGEFRVVWQPRAGLDYFKPDLEKAKGQLASVTALMDDVEPHNEMSPAIIHVVSYSEGLKLADPAVINESIQITRAALERYRTARKKGTIEDLSKNSAVQERTRQLFADANYIIEAIESHVPDPYSVGGFYKIFVAGFLPTPYLWNESPQFARARKWQTGPLKGGISLLDEFGKAVTPQTRVIQALEGLQDAEYYWAHRAQY